jgi:hypothetical protein
VSPCELRADIPATLGAAILRCLDRNPDARFQNVGGLAAALRPHAGANAPRAIASGHPFAFASAEVLDDVARRDTAPSSGCLVGVVHTGQRLSTSAIPGVRSRRPFWLAVGTLALVGALAATFRHRGYQFEDITLDRATVSGAWSSVQSSAANALDFLDDVSTPTPPLPAAVPAVRPAPPVELPSQLEPLPAAPAVAAVAPQLRALQRPVVRHVRPRNAAPVTSEPPAPLATATFETAPASP